MNLKYAFMEAIRKNNLKYLNLLIEDGVKVNFWYCFWERTPLEYAASLGHLKIVQTLIDNGAELCDSLLWACRYGRLRVVKTLLKNGADVNEPVEHRGLTPLHAAAITGQLKVVQFLLSSGANPHAKDADGETPLIVLYNLREQGLLEGDSAQIIDLLERIA